MSHTPRRIESAMAVAYSQLAPLRAAVASIPFAGAALDALLGTHGQNITTRRLDQTICEIRRQAALLDEAKLDVEYLQSDDFFDLFWRVHERCLRTSQQERVRLYVRVLLRSSQGPPYRDNAQEYLDLLAGLSMPEIRVACAIYERQSGTAFDPDRALTEPGLTANATDLQGDLDDMPPAHVSAYLSRLERTGLVRELIGAYCGYLGGAYHITDYFRGMMAYLALEDLRRVP